MAEVSVKSGGLEYGFRNQIQNTPPHGFIPQFSGLGGSASAGNYTFRGGKGSIIDELNQNAVSVNKRILRLLGFLNRAYHEKDKDEFDDLLAQAHDEFPSTMDGALGKYHSSF